MDVLNIEIKAHCDNPDRIREILLAHHADFKGEDHQIDTYFVVPEGRLKLREGNIENTLIYYDRVEVKGIKKSIVELFHPQQDVASLKKILLKTMPVKVVVDKRRAIYFIDNVKFHIDQVKGLGSFMEIEAISEGGQFTEEYLNRQCQHYIQLLEVGKDDFIDQSYSDLLLT
ncbi:MAG TPA: CYTH domain-containing protein [Saprospiraceae bacterium]|nr:CYTH domain-containing protein [Saprospiraceae bacterium]